GSPSRACCRRPTSATISPTGAVRSRSLPRGQLVAGRRSSPTTPPPCGRTASNRLQEVYAAEPARALRAPVFKFVRCNGALQGCGPSRGNETQEYLRVSGTGALNGKRLEAYGAKAVTRGAAQLAAGGGMSCDARRERSARTRRDARGPSDLLHRRGR